MEDLTGRFLGWIGYDADCALCVRLADWARASLQRRGFCLVPLQTPWMNPLLGREAGRPFAEMKLIKPDGRVIGGARAVVDIARHTWWLWPLAWIGSWPGGMHVLTHGYRWIARNRTCTNGVCSTERDQTGRTAWLPLIVLPVTVVWFKKTMLAWTFMWVLVMAIFVGCKWLSLKTVRPVDAGSLRRRLMFLLGWPGMDATLFLNRHRFVKSPSIASWNWAATKTLLGAALIWGVVRLIPAHWPMAQGWLGMLGLVLMLHFGLFDLLAFFWKKFGVMAEPIMRSPIRAVSLAELWGCRWNAAFHQLVHHHVFRPAARRLRAQGAMWLVFLVSGLIHDLVISLPAGGGYGLPTAYFAFQAMGISIERSRPGRTLGLGEGWRGWLFTMVVALAPIGWLFHRDFIVNVILPFLHAIKAM